MITTDVKLLLNKFWKWHRMGTHNGLLRPPLYHHGGTPLAGAIMPSVHLKFFVQGQEGRTQRSRINIQRPVVLHHRKCHLPANHNIMIIISNTYNNYWYLFQILIEMSAQQMFVPTMLATGVIYFIKGALCKWRDIGHGSCSQLGHYQCTHV